MNSFEAQIITPEGSVFSDNVVGVKLPGSEGSFEVKTLHADIISTLNIGDVLVRNVNGSEQHFAISGGFVEVHDNKLTLLAEAAEAVEDIDIKRAKEAKKRAEQRLESDSKEMDETRAKKALKRAENRIKLAAKFSLSTR